MKVRVLGSVSPYAKGNSNCPGFMIEDEGYKVLLDAGNGITRMLNMPDDLKNLTVIISHLHKDHYGDLSSIGYASYCYNNLGMLNQKIELYVPYDSRYYNPDYIECLIPGFHDYMMIKHMSQQYWNLHDIKKRKIQIGPMAVEFLNTLHFNGSSYAIKVKNKDISLVYTSDMGYKNAKDLITFAKDSDLLISESSFIREHNQFSEEHLHAYQAAEIAKYAKVKKLLLTHFWPETPKEKYLEEAKAIFDNTDVAIEGTEYVLGR